MMLMEGSANALSGGFVDFLVDLRISAVSCTRGSSNWLLPFNSSLPSVLRSPWKSFPFTIVSEMVTCVVELGLGQFTCDW